MKHARRSQEFENYHEENATMNHERHIHESDTRHTEETPMRHRRHTHDFDTHHTEETPMETTRHPRHSRHNHDGETRSCGHSNARHAGRSFGGRARDAWRDEQHDAPEMAERRYRRGHRDVNAIETESGRHGRHAGHHARGAWSEMRGGQGSQFAGRRDSSGKGRMVQTIVEMKEQIATLERRVRRMQRQAQMQAAGPDEQIDIHRTHRRVVRTRRQDDGEQTRGYGRRGGHGHDLGRRMGRMSNRSWRERQHDI